VEREVILDNARSFFKANSPKPIVPGVDYIPASGKLLDQEDLVNLIDSSLDMWLTSGRYYHTFEKEFAKFMSHAHCLLVNSGSSANLIAFSALTSPMLGKDAIKAGDEVITVAAGFPTTVNPIIQNGCIPVFIDIDKLTHQIDIELLESALSAKTSAVMIAHTLGNPFDAVKVKKFCDDHDLWLIEDCCDAIGAKLEGQLVGTFGDFATASFYPAHHMTMGEGGAVLTSNPRLKKIAESFRDWGRDCWCPTGKDNSCGKRFSWEVGELPSGYDHKYIYSHIGYNLKATDMQAALGVSQLKKLPSFIKKRNENADYLSKKLQELSDKILLPVSTQGSEPSWFGFSISLKESSQISRNELIKHLEKNKIGTRLLFAGNLIKHPLYQNSEKRIIGTLPNSDFVMTNTFWVGVHPQLNFEHMDYIAQKIREGLGDRL
jgi:CDP-4-dehydro-6-deoxyglucose reductase, E1